jgi:FMN-dependent NADH-azoreductase
VPHITAAGISARVTDRALHIPEQAAAQAVQDELVEEFLRAGGYLLEGRDHLVPNIQEILGVDMGIEIRFITSSWGLAEVLPMLAPLIPQHRDSLAAAHTAAREAGAGFRLHPVAELPKPVGSQTPATRFSTTG